MDAKVHKTLDAVNTLLHALIQRRGSDLFLTVGAPPCLKIDGEIVPASSTKLDDAATRAIARAVMNDRQDAEFQKTRECNFAYSPAGVGRFRVNAFQQQGYVGLVFRTINSQVPTLDDLQLPLVLKDLALQKRGLIIFVGGTGTGKTTSLAAFVDHRNRNTKGHIITLEDPIEFVHEHQGCLVTQREIGYDSDSWDIALKNTLRQAPDVILMGEIRDRETMNYAIAFSETGHLCLATLHANNANQALERVLNFFPEERHPKLLLDLSLNLRAIISQRLIPRENSKGRVAAVEILRNTPAIQDRISKGEVTEIKDLMKKGREQGMQTFDQHLFELYDSGMISKDDALRFADSLNDLRLRIKLEAKRQEQGRTSDGAGLTLVPDGSGH